MYDLCLEIPLMDSVLAAIFQVNLD